LKVDRGATSLPAARVACRILNDANEPAAQVARLHPIERSIGGDQSLLQRIIGAGRLTSDPERHPPGEVKVGAKEGAEGFRIACPRRAEETKALFGLVGRKPIQLTHAVMMPHR